MKAGGANELPAWFAELDENNDGKITLEELRKWVLAHGFGDQSAAELFEALDTNHDGIVEPSDVVKRMSTLMDGGMGGGGGGHALNELTALKHVPVDVDFSDLYVPTGADGRRQPAAATTGFDEPRVERRCITLAMLRSVYAHIQRRCTFEKWTDQWGQPLQPETVRASHAIERETPWKRTQIQA